MRPNDRWEYVFHQWLGPQGGPPSGPRLPYNDGASWNQTMLGFDAIQKF